MPSVVVRAALRRPTFSKSGRVVGRPTGHYSTVDKHKLDAAPRAQPALRTVRTMFTNFFEEDRTTTPSALRVSRRPLLYAIDCEMDSIAGGEATSDSDFS
jgi:hypothetical protein